MNLKKLLKGSVLAVGMAVGSLGTAAHAAIVDLAFVLDGSGSVSASDYNLARTALSNALGLIPTSGADQYRLGVVTFGSTVTTLVPPTILTAANIAGVQATVASAAKNGGGTFMSGAINRVVSDFAAVGLGATSLINVTTDGFPNSQTATTASAAAASAAGWDSLSFEAVGPGAATAYLAGIAFPQPSVIVASGGAVPNPLTTGFVLQVTSFADYQTAINSKVSRIVNPNPIPLPGALPLVASGFAAFGALRLRRRKAAA